MNRWQQKEHDDSKTFEGKRVKGSGNFWTHPGDVKTEKFLIDSKDTTKASYSLSKKTLDKLYEEALFSYRIPILSIRIQNMEVVVLFKEDFKKLIKKDQ